MAAAAPDCLFVYGSLMSGIPVAARPIEARAPFAALSADARLIGPASATGRLFAVAWYPGFVPGRSPGEQVRGEVWRLTHPGRVLAALDDYEGRGYARACIGVKLDAGVRLEAFAYRLADDPGAAPRIESGDYLAWMNLPPQARA